MHRSKFFLTSIFALTASQAAADVTPSDVWSALQKTLELSAPQSVTFGTVIESPNEILVTDTVLSIEQDDGEDRLTVTATLPEIKLVDRGDGTVELTYAERSTVKFGFGESGEGFGMDVLQTNMRYIVSGDPEQMNYAMSGDAISLTLTDADFPKETVTGTASMVFEGLVGNSVMTGSGEALEGYSGNLNIDTATFDVAFEDQSDNTKMNMKGSMQDFAVNADLAMSDLAAFATDDPAAIFSAAEFGGRYSIGPSSFALDADLGPGERFSANYSDTGTGLDFNFGKGTLDYSIFINGMALSMLIPDALPFPIDASLGRLATKLAIPIEPNVENPYEIGMTVKELMLDDNLWSLFDPTEVFPRDLVTIDLQVSGLATPLYNLFDPAEATRLGSDETPGEVNSLTIDAFEIDALGLTADGTGAFTFDWTDFQTIPEMPRPEGIATLSVTGANALMDKLITMGVITAEDAMGARMMMAMFAQPGDAPDSLATQLEVRKNGHVLVNGQRLR